MTTKNKLYTLLPPVQDTDEYGTVKFLDFEEYAFADKEITLTLDKTKGHLLLFALLFGNNYTDVRFETFVKLLQSNKTFDNEIANIFIEANSLPIIAVNKTENSKWFNIQRKFAIEARIMRVAYNFVASETLPKELKLSDVVTLLPAVEVFLALQQQIGPDTNFKQNKSALLFHRHANKCIGLRIICDMLLHVYMSNGTPFYNGVVHATSLILPSFLDKLYEILHSDKFAELAALYYTNVAHALTMAYRLELIYADENTFNPKLIVDNDIREISNRNWLSFLQSNSLVEDDSIDKSKEAAKMLGARYNWFDIDHLNTDSTDIHSINVDADNKSFTLIDSTSSDIEFELSSAWYSSAKQIPQFFVYNSQYTEDYYESAVLVYQTQCVFFAVNDLQNPLKIIKESTLCCCLDVDMAKYINAMVKNKERVPADLTLPEFDKVSKPQKFKYNNMPWFIQKAAAELPDSYNVPTDIGHFSQITNAITQDSLFHTKLYNN